MKDFIRFKLKPFALWLYDNVFVKYLQFRYRTTIMTLARLTLLILAKELFSPFIYLGMVLLNYWLELPVLDSIISASKDFFIPGWPELLIAVLAVVVLLIVAFVQYRIELNAVRKHDEIMEHVYVNYADEILRLLDAENYHAWIWQFALGGNTIIHYSLLDNMELLVNYCNSRVKHEGYEELDKLIENLGLLINDFLYFFCRYSADRRDGVCTVERFYKQPGTFNKNYHEDLKRYEDVCYMCADLMFEQTRICNRILEIIRKRIPDYMVTVGILTVDNIQDHNVYRENENIESPYTGIETFKELRHKRSYCLAGI